MEIDPKKLDWPLSLLMIASLFASASSQSSTVTRASSVLVAGSSARSSSVSGASAESHCPGSLARIAARSRSFFRHLDQELSHSGIGPQRVRVNQSELDQIRVARSPRYQIAEEFARTYAGPLNQTLSDLSMRDGKVNIVVAMGGAEHLGNLAQLVLSQRPDRHRFQLIFIDLSTQRLGFWTAVSEKTGKGLSGVGPLPPGFVHTKSQTSDLADLKQHLESFGVFDGDQVVVLDTGYRGSTTEVIAQFARMRPFPIQVEGALVARSDSVENTVPIIQLPQNDELIDRRIPDFWANALDCNNLDGCQQTLYGRDAFPRSSTMVNAVVSENSSYKETVAGLADGIRESKLTTVSNQSQSKGFGKKRKESGEFEQYNTLWDLESPVAKRAEAQRLLLERAAKLRSTGHHSEVERYKHQLVADLSRVDSYFGTALVLLNKAELRTYESGHRLAGYFQLEDHFSYHPKALSVAPPPSFELMIAERLRAARMRSSPLQGARTLDEYLAHMLSPDQRAFRERSTQTISSLSRPIRESVSIGASDPSNLIYYWTQDKDQGFYSVWRNLGLEEEFKTQFLNKDEFLKSERSFIDIYLELLKLKSR